jgi:NAD-dependent deacetylase
MRTALLQPRRLAEFLLAVLEPIARARPNAAHAALAELEQLQNLTVVTQNIDGLHQAAGTARVLEIHGSILQIVDVFKGQTLRTLTREELADVAEKLRTTMEQGWTALSLMQAIRPLMGGGLTQAYRPNLILFGDALAEPAWSQSLAVVRECDLLLCIGTSGTVYPAASLPEQAREHGAKVIAIDPVTGGSDCWLKGSAESVLPGLVTSLRAT